MATVTFIAPDGTPVIAEGSPPNLMFLARMAKVPGILGKCGGVCSCATCHVHVHPDYLAAVGPAGEQEQDILDLQTGTDTYSRLSCQIDVTDAIDGATFRVAE